MNGNTERAQCALSLVCIPQEMGKKGSKKNKKVYKIFKKRNKKIMPSGPLGGDRPAFWRKEGWRKPEIQRKGESSKGGK